VRDDGSISLNYTDFNPDGNSRKSNMIEAVSIPLLDLADCDSLENDAAEDDSEKLYEGPATLKMFPELSP